MTLLAISIAVVLIVSALCSVTEAALYAVRMSYVRNLTDAGSFGGSTLLNLKENMERPISAILIVNTAANTAGAAIAGAQAKIYLGDESLIWFSACFTLAVLFCAEIVPKILGVAYSDRISPLIALPLEVLAKALFPMVWSVQQLSRFLKPQGPVFAAPEDEVHQMAMMSAAEGSILQVEADLVRNVLKLNDVTAEQIMTPASVVFKLPAEMTFQEVSQSVTTWPNSRIPVYSRDQPEVLVGVALRRDILSAMADGRLEQTLDSLKKPLHFVTTATLGHILLQAFLKRRSHLFGVVDEHGKLVGIVTLEDVLESLIGEEIVDETDTIIDMRKTAKRDWWRT